MADREDFRPDFFPPKLPIVFFFLFFLIFLFSRLLSFLFCGLVRLSSCVLAFVFWSLVFGPGVVLCSAEADSSSSTPEPPQVDDMSKQGWVWLSTVDSVAIEHGSQGKVKTKGTYCVGDDEQSSVKPYSTTLHMVLVVLLLVIHLFVRAIRTN